MVVTRLGLLGHVLAVLVLVLGLAACAPDPSDEATSPLVEGGFTSTEGAVTDTHAVQITQEEYEKGLEECRDVDDVPGGARTA